MNPNIDAKEINKFSQLADQWWDPNGPMRPLHQLNPLRLDYIKQHNPISNQRILDIGCGGGILAEAMAKAGALVTGIDKSHDALAAARQHAEQQSVNLDYIDITAEEYSQLHPNKFDIVTCLEMLEHVPEPSSIIKACHTLVKPGGAVFFSTINRNLKSFLLAIVGAEYILRLLPRGTHEYAKFIQPAQLNHWAEQNHLKLKDIIGIHFNPLSQRFSLRSNVDVNYMSCYEKL